MLSRALHDIRDGLLSITYPQDCHLCGGLVDSWDDGVVCDGCWDEPAVTKILTRRVCLKCGSPVSRPEATAGAVAAFDGRLCGMCQSLPFSAARACGIYSGAIEASILFLKSHPHVCNRLRRIIAHTLSEHWDVLAGEVVVPVSLHFLRERERGFNQAKTIANVICREYNLPLDDRSLARIKATERHRAGMDRTDRTRSVQGAFEVVRPRLISGLSVLLVDDIYTTGSTICSAADALMRAGARQVSVLTVARVG